MTLKKTLYLVKKFKTKESRKKLILANFINKLLKISLILKTLFTMRNKQKIDKKSYYWVKI